MKRLAIVAIVIAVAISLMANLRTADVARMVNRLPGRDATAHFVLMGLLGFFVVLGFSPARLRGRRLGALGCTLLVLVAVTAEEASQALIPSRSFSVGDLLASYAGIVTAGLAAGLVLARNGRIPAAGSRDNP